MAQSPSPTATNQEPTDKRTPAHPPSRNQEREKGKAIGARFPDAAVEAGCRNDTQASPTLTCDIDDRHAAAKTLITPGGMVFTKDRGLGQKLWRIVNSVPWAKRPWAISWFIYGLVVYVSRTSSPSRADGDLIVCLLGSCCGRAKGRVFMPWMGSKKV